MFNKKAICACLGALILSFCNITNAQNNVDDNMSLKGAWHDSRTGLIWMRCSLGQTWTGKDCKGNAKEYSWWDAIRAADKYTFGELNDWRIPSVLELSTLLAGDVLNGQVAYDKDNGDGAFFSLDTLTKEKIEQIYAYSGVKGYKKIELFQPVDNKFGAYWSAAPLNSSHVWLLDFDYGGVGKQYKSNKNYVRLVRGVAIADDFEKSLNLVKSGDIEEQDYIKEWTEENARQAKIAAEEKAQRDREAEAEHQEQARLKREAGLPPQAMYLQAGKYDRNGQKYDAIRLYELLVDKYSDSPLAIQATNRLVAMRADTEAADRLRRETDRAIDAANRQQSQSSAECHRRKEAYKLSCGDSGWQCYERAKSICSE